MSDERLARAPTPRHLLALRHEAERLSERLPGLLVEAERVAATVAQGVHGRRRTGLGETFWQFRSYQAGDDASRIDWRQSARSRHLFVREQEWEAAESVWLWCDLSRSMQFRSSRRLVTKQDRTLILAFGLAALLVRAGERVSLLGSGERPHGGKHGLNMLSRSLAAAAGEDSLPPQVPLPRFARLVLLSDFLEPVETLRRRLAPYITGGARACLLQVNDPVEENLPYEGRVQFEGLEQDGQALIGNVGSVRERYRARFATHREELVRLGASRGWRFAAHRTDHGAESALLTLYQMLAPRTVR
ncbi:DUF58 domain-containing protein [Geminicoccaceae bacterium 1502E]|nr:DUF58 domain-containing protein [Geminicoccaceae bacterium 1502E]